MRGRLIRQSGWYSRRIEIIKFQALVPVVNSNGGKSFFIASEKGEKL
jgi:hypothetical protein